MGEAGRLIDERQIKYFLVFFYETVEERFSFPFHLFIYSFLNVELHICHVRCTVLICFTDTMTENKKKVKPFNG